MKLLKYFTVAGISILVSVAAIVSSSAATVFKDQGEIDKLPWAKAAIQIMAEKGIITGMDGGNFNPNTAVKKLDSLIITAKVLGAGDPLNKPELDKADTSYGALLTKYNLPYGKKEIAYLLYSKVLDESELVEYIGTNNIQAHMMRHEAAIILVKALGKEQEVKNKTLVILPFVDQSSIPEKARPYVDYLQKQKLMSGISDTEFSPFTPLTRAQMSVLLSKVLTLLPEKVKVDDKVSVVKQGYISSYSTSLTGNTIRVRAVEASDGATEEYVITSNTQIYKNGAITNIDGLETGDTVSLDLNSAGNVLKVSAKSKNSSINGTIKSIIMDHPISIVVTVENFEKTIQVSDSVAVTRNNFSASFKDLRVGDSVKTELEYEKAQIINATGAISTLEDTVLDEMVIAAVPRITVRDSSNNLKEFSILRDPSIKINGEEKTFYDLRVGMKLKLTLDSGTVTRIEAELVKTAESYTGVIEVFNRNLRTITLNIPATQNAPGYQKQILLKEGSIMVTNAKTGGLVSFETLKPGVPVTVYGNNEMGVFVATQIILLSLN